MKNSVVFFILAVLFCGCNQQEADKNTAPNIVFILTDDQTFNSIHALGNTEIHTPNLNRLVAQGTTFTHAYNMGSWSGAVCAASRAMLISGRPLWQANAFRKNWINKDSLDLTWGRIMQTHGYDTYMTGKWHVDAAAKNVFESVKNVRPGMPSDAWNHALMVQKFDSLNNVGSTDYESIMPFGYNRPKTLTDTLWQPQDTSNGGFWKGGKHWSEVLANDALEFIAQADKSTNPFFMYLAFNAPHDPRQAPKEFLDMYDIEHISVPKSFLAEYPYRNHIKNGNNLRDEALAPFPRTIHAIKTHLKEYYAIITHLDYQIGVILDAVEDLNGKNTYVIFTSDHGLAMGKHGLLGKQNLFDHSIRVPLIIAGPDVPKNKKIKQDVYLQDAMATALDIAGIDKPNYVWFNSFFDIAKGEKMKGNYKAIYGAYLDVQRMIRKDNFKLLVYPKINKTLLFDLNNDPEEMQNLAQVPEHKYRVKALFNALLELQKEMDDPLDLSHIYNNIN